MTRDLRYAVRTLPRSPVFTATALLSIALGVGASTAIFSLVDRVLLRSLAIANPEQLVSLAWKGNALASGWWSGYVMSYPMCHDLERAGTGFDGAFCRRPGSVRSPCSWPWLDSTA
jgi:putative ABC transport system permease protein